MCALIHFSSYLDDHATVVLDPDCSTSSQLTEFSSDLRSSESDFHKIDTKASGILLHFIFMGQCLAYIFSYF
jgi:hypothetical protein